MSEPTPQPTHHSFFRNIASANLQPANRPHHGENVSSLAAQDLDNSNDGPSTPAGRTGQKRRVPEASGRKDKV